MTFAMYFLASEEKVRSWLPGWSEPNPEPVVQKARNPGTGELFEVLAYVGERPAVEIMDVQSIIERAIDATEIAAHRDDPLDLWVTITGSRPTGKRAAELRRPFLVGPSPEQEVYRVDSELVALVKATDQALDSILGADLRRLLSRSSGTDAFVLLEVD